MATHMRPLGKNGRTIFIYHLLDQDWNVRYVGKTANLVARYNGHIASRTCRQGRNRHVVRWIARELAAGRRIEMRVARLSSEQHWERDERDEIHLQRCRGENLCNRTVGGIGVRLRRRIRHKTGRGRQEVLWSARGQNFIAGMYERWAARQNESEMSALDRMIENERRERGAEKLVEIRRRESAQRAGR